MGNPSLSCARLPQIYVASYGTIIKQSGSTKLIVKMMKLLLYSTHTLYAASYATIILNSLFNGVTNEINAKMMLLVLLVMFNSPPLGTWWYRWLVQPMTKCTGYVALDWAVCYPVLVHRLRWLSCLPSLFRAFAKLTSRYVTYFLPTVQQNSE